LGTAPGAKPVAGIKAGGKGGNTASEILEDGFIGGNPVISPDAGVVGTKKPKGGKSTDTEVDDMLGGTEGENVLAEDPKATDQEAADANMQLDGNDPSADTTKPGNTSDSVVKITKTSEVTVAQAVQKPQRIVVFNLIDSDMNGSLSMQEFFVFLRQSVVFSVLAGQDTNLMAFDITKKSYEFNKDEVTT